MAEAGMTQKSTVPLIGSYCRTLSSHRTTGPTAARCDVPPAGKHDACSVTLETLETPRSSLWEVQTAHRAHLKSPEDLTM